MMPELIILAKAEFIPAKSCINSDDDVALRYGAYHI